MNRADQAPEPSMEELLASIRLIISDADKKVPPQKEPSFPGIAAAEPASAGGEEVFELTDELVFPEGQPAALPASPEGRRAPALADEVAGSQVHAAPRRGAPPSITPLATGVQAAPVRLERHKQAAPPVSRPIWSGRELPAASAHPQLAAPRLRGENAAARPQAKNWAADVQLPIPEQGPVSLFSTEAGQEPAAVEAASAGEKAFGDAAGAATAEGAVEVAALAQRLARSAIGVLEASELETAKQVDFEHLDAESKAEVSQRFADAIEREGAPHGAPALTGSLDSAIAEVRKQERLQSGAAQDLGFEAATASGGMAAQEEESEPATLEQPESVRPSPAGAGAAQLSAKPAPANPASAQPLAHAQFVGPAQVPVPSQPGRTLEDAVREMLRPLLVQWLNENMPRILENAIREEIAVRGLLPKLDS